jgi:SAM-dependent methyltransferase
MVVTPAAAASLEPAVIWHDLECGGYRADLPLWRRLATDAATGGPGALVLDIGAGSGRVTLDLARAGHRLSALDISEALLAALSARAAGLAVETTLADGRRFRLAREDHDLCIVPMQTLQLLRGADERRALFTAARAHLRDGGLLACAIVTEVDPFDSRAGGPGPSPERATVAGRTYISRAIRLECLGDLIRIERERLVITDGGPTGPVELDVVELERVEAEQLWSEARDAGLCPEPTVRVAETAEHSGSEVVMLRA